MLIEKKSMNATRIFLLNLILISFIFFEGCSTVELAYDYDYWYVLHKIDSTFDLKASQEKLVRKYLIQFHSWHRKNELPKYIDYLERIRLFIGLGFNRDQLDQMYARFDQLRVDSTVKLIPFASDFLTKLDQEQINRLEKVFLYKNKEIEDEIALELNVKQEKLFQKTKNRVEDLIGTLTEKQIRLISEFAMNISDFDIIHLSHRKEGQQMFMEQIRRTNTIHSNEALLTELWINAYNENDSDYCKQRIIYRDKNKNLIMDLRKSITTDQKNLLLKRLKELINDFKELHLES